MAKVEMYCTAMCGYCVRAEMLLSKKGVEVEKIRIDQDPARMQEMLQRAHGRRTVPQIFINDMHVGGFDDLAELDMDGKLDPLLAHAS
jgi:glutaredoxin 3